MKDSEMTDLKTSIAMVLDRSGSMNSCRQPTIDAVNKYLLEARADSALKEADFELMIFDSESIDTIRSGKTCDVKDITPEEFEPRASTPLFDAIGRAIDSLDAKAKDGKAILVVVTDGYENHSRKHTLESMSALIQERQARSWLIVFLGAGLGAAQQGTAMGIRAASVANIAMDEASLSATMSNVREMNAGYAATATMAARRCFIDEASFSAEDRKAMGDTSGGAGIIAPSKKAAASPFRHQSSSTDAWPKAPGDAWSNQ
jgi:hypothetical protein